MSDKKIFEWNIEIDNRDIDKTDKKLRSLDKLLQQTQRRAATLGKTRIKPVISLDDRFTSTERKITDRLKQLGRTTVKPTVMLNDRVSAGATRIRASLASLTATPWRISVAGVNWQQVVGGSFNNWMSSSGKSTMKSISAAISSSISGGVQNAIQQALSMVGVITKGATGNGNGNPTPGIPTKPKTPAIGPSGFPKFHPIDLINGFTSGLSQKPSPAETSSPSDKTKPDDSKKKESLLDKTRSFTEDLGKDLLKDLLKDGIKSIIDKLRGKDSDSKKCTCICICKCDCGRNGTGGMIGGDEKDGDRNKKKDPKKGSNSEDPTKSSNRNKAEGGESNKTSNRKPKVMPWFKKITELVKEKGPGWVNNVKNWVGKNSKVLGPIATVATVDYTDKAAFDIGDWIFGHEKGQAYTKPGIFKNPFKMEKYEDYRPGIAKRIKDYLYGVDTKEEPTISTHSSTSFDYSPIETDYMKFQRFQSDLYSFKYGKKNQNSGVPIQKPKKNSNDFFNQFPLNNKSQSSINVSVSQGAVNLTVNKDEINYDELAKKAGLKIANEVRFAMQNLK